ncbi:MAG TPA: DEAD/DEAH box helicase, partial [Polyangiaceae bacterium]|nr:DEAD/DEAH box helicase [Polyangiaceae bacterium]
MALARSEPRVPPLVLAPGARVEIRGEEWIVRKAEPTSTGDTAVHVTGLSELVRNRNAIFLTALERDLRVLEPEETLLAQDPSPGYRRTRLYLESLLRQSPPTDSRLYRGHRGAMNRAEYQLVPAAKALAQARPRILIADAVGLGKTIEVGVLLSELIRRGRGRRILVVALKSVLEQFQEELWARFTIPLVRLDSLGLERVQRKIPANHNPFYYFDRVIISIDTLKKDEKYRRFLNDCHWDAVVVDECQHVAVRGGVGPAQRSQRAKLASLLARTSEALILTSATPHDGKKESFGSLMNLLEPTAIADDTDYTASDVAGLFVRRFKKDVQAQVRGSFQERQIRSLHVDAGSEENAVFELLHTAQFKTIHPRRPRAPNAEPVRETTEPEAATEYRGSGGGILFRTLLLKAFLSSPEALIETVDARLSHKRLVPLSRAGRSDFDTESETDPDAQHDVKLLTTLRRAAEKVVIKKNSKLQRLLQLLGEMGVGRDSRERVVIFSERIATLELLQKQLQPALQLKPQNVAVFHGTLDDQEQQKLVKDFGNEKSSVRVLLASDAASEGVNLHHFCHHLIHYDLPWSLITLEQRNGRIDRFGQTRVPELHYLLTRPANPVIRGDLRVLDVLIDKERAAHENLGDVRWLMNLHDAEAEEDRVAEGISQHEPAEVILPDPEPETDFLATLVSEWQKEARDDHRGRPLEVSSETVLGNDGISPNAVIVPEPCEPLRLFANDLEFAKEAFLELVESEPSGLPAEARLKAPQWEDQIRGFNLVAPLDLRERYRFLPPELHQRGNDWTFKLTCDRELVQKALERSRQSENGWPEYELFWEQHPIAEWLNDRMAAHFRRHEAPLLSLPRGLTPGECAFVFQGVLSNQRSQPMLVEWFAVIFGLEDGSRVEPLTRLIERVQLTEALVNPGRTLDVTRPTALRGAAVAAAREHMTHLREARRERLTPVLKAGQQRL